MLAAFKMACLHYAPGIQGLVVGSFGHQEKMEQHMEKAGVGPKWDGVKSRTHPMWFFNF